MVKLGCCHIPTSLLKVTMANTYQWVRKDNPNIGLVTDGYRVAVQSAFNMTVSLAHLSAQQLIDLHYDVSQFQTLSGVSGELIAK